MPYRLLTCANADASGEQSLDREGDDLEPLNQRAHELSHPAEGQGVACVIENANGGETTVVAVYPATPAPEQTP